jgi:hypothetical protein
MSDALREDRLKVRPKRRERVPRLRVVRDVGDRRRRVAEHVRPLLDLLKEILGEQRRVRRAVLDLHFRALACEDGKPAAGQVSLRITISSLCPAGMLGGKPILAAS